MKIDNHGKLKSFFDELYAIDSPPSKSIDREAFESSVRSDVNGDNFIDNLIIVGNISKNRPGLAIYVLTNAKLIKIEIDEKGVVESSARYLSGIVEIKRKRSEGVAVIEIIFRDNEGFGLRYPIHADVVDKFFQLAEKAASDARSR